jgi:hypothetical protein
MKRPLNPGATIRPFEKAVGKLRVEWGKPKGLRAGHRDASGSPLESPHRSNYATACEKRGGRWT